MNVSGAGMHTMEGFEHGVSRGHLGSLAPKRREQCYGEVDHIREQGDAGGYGWSCTRPLRIITKGKPPALPGDSYSLTAPGGEVTNSL
jgi:hypothetical protein